MLVSVAGKPFFFQADEGDEITIVSLSHKAGPNVPAFRYASEPLEVEDIDVGDGKTQPGATFTVIKGRRRLSALAPFATNPPKGEFFFQEVMRNGNNVSLQLLGSAVPGDEAISWTIEGL
jgi:hypothetical protein